MQSIVDHEITKQELLKRYSKTSDVRSVLKIPKLDDDVSKRMVYAHMSPEDPQQSKYPHTYKGVRYSHEILLNDHVFRNGNANIGLGYYSSN